MAGRGYGPLGPLLRWGTDDLRIALRYVEGETLAQKLSRLGKSGDAAATVWTNDLTHDYVHENSAYST